jgi:hypothetical protein
MVSALRLQPMNFSLGKVVSFTKPPSDAFIQITFFPDNDMVCPLARVRLDCLNNLLIINTPGKTKSQNNAVFRSSVPRLGQPYPGKTFFVLNEIWDFFITAQVNFLLNFYLFCYPLKPEMFFSPEGK